MEFGKVLLTLILVDAALTYVCFQKGKHWQGWIGVAGLFGLAPLLLWFPLAGALEQPEPDSAWAGKTETGGPVGPSPRTPPIFPGVTPTQTPVTPRSAYGDLAHQVSIGRFLDDARAQDLIDGSTYRRLLDALDHEMAEAPPDILAPALTPVVERPPAPLSPEPVPVFVPGPRPLSPTPPEPKPMVGVMSNMWEAVSSDIALHGFSYLGVLLTFVAVLGFLLFSFADVPDAAQPFVELVIAFIFFGWAWLLRRQEAAQVGAGMELIGGMVLPLSLFAGLVDNAPFPPDFTGGGLIAALTLTAVLIAVVYAWISARRPGSMLRYLVAPLIWLAALTLGFVFKTDEPLAGVAITRLVSPQPALATVAIALTLLFGLRRPQHRLSLPSVRSAMVGLPVAYLLTVSLAFGDDWARIWPITVLGAATMASAETLVRWYQKPGWVPLIRPLLLMGVLAPQIPSLQPGWAGLVIAIAYVALFELSVRSSPDWLRGIPLTGVGIAIGAALSLSAPWPTLVTFTLLTIWAHTSRLRDWQREEVTQLFRLGAALLPIGIGGGLLQILRPPIAWLVMASILGVVAVVVRARTHDDRLWPFWLLGATGAVSVGVIDVWNRAPDLLGPATILVAAATVALLTLRPLLRIWVTAGLLCAAMAMAMETADLPSGTKLLVWAGLGLLLVATSSVMRRWPAAHLGAIGHLIGAGALLAPSTGPTRTVVVGCWALGWVAATITDQVGGDTLTALLRSRVPPDRTRWISGIGWIVPVLAVISVPPAVITAASLWPAFASHPSWTGLTLAALAVIYAGFARVLIDRMPMARILAIGAVVGSILGVAAAGPDPWPMIVSSLMLISVSVALGPELRWPWFVWVAWLTSVLIVVLVGKEAGVPPGSLHLVSLTWGAILLLGGLVADDLISGRREPSQGLRVQWLRYPVLIGAVVLPMSLTQVFVGSPRIYGWWLLGAGVVNLLAAYLLRLGAVTFPGYGLIAIGVTVLSPVSLMDRPWLFVLIAAPLVGLSWWSEHVQPDTSNPWVRWDLAPLVVAHLVAVFGLLVALDIGADAYATPLGFGAVSVVVGIWKRHRAWIEAGNLLILVGAGLAGPGWPALTLAGTSARGMIGARFSEGRQRLSYQVLGSVTAGLAWLALLDWQRPPVLEAIGFSALVFGGVALALGVTDRLRRLEDDTLSVWGGLALIGVVVATGASVTPDIPAITDVRLAAGLVMLATAFELLWRRFDPMFRVFAVLVTGAAWLALIPGLGWDRATALSVTAVVFGGLMVVVSEIMRSRPVRQTEDGAANLLAAMAWSWLAVIGVAVAVFAYRGDRSDGYVLAIGLALLALGLARGAIALGVEPLRIASLLAGLIALNLVAHAAAWPDGPFATGLVLLATGAGSIMLWLWRRRPGSPWSIPLAVLAAAVNLETIYFAVEASPTRPLGVAVLLSIAVNALSVGLVRSLPGALALAPPAVGLAFIVGVGESVGGSAQWITVPVAVVLLIEVEILRWMRLGAGVDPNRTDTLVMEAAGIGLLAAPGLVEMFTRTAVYGLVVFGVAVAVMLWAIVSKVRRRLIAAASIATATAVLLIFAVAAAAAPGSALVWIVAAGIGFALLLVTGLVESYRSRRGRVMLRLYGAMEGWE
ncbi:MAG: hypothetical protein ACRDWS_06095 [Acidimicrobiia bacterium]